MLPQVLAMVIKGGPEGGTVDIGIAPFVIGALPFVVAIVAIVMGFWFVLNKKRLEHQQILAAIEKGTPLSELRPLKDKGPSWIVNISAGIGLMLMGLGIMTVILTVTRGKIEDDSGMGLVVGFVFLAVGITRLIRGIIQKKAEKALSDKLTLDANNGQ